MWNHICELTIFTTSLEFHFFRNLINIVKMLIPTCFMLYFQLSWTCVNCFILLYFLNKKHVFFLKYKIFVVLDCLIIIDSIRKVTEQMMKVFGNKGGSGWSPITFPTKKLIRAINFMAVGRVCKKSG